MFVAIKLLAGRKGLDGRWSSPVCKHRCLRNKLRYIAFGRIISHFGNRLLSFRCFLTTLCLGQPSVRPSRRPCNGKNGLVEITWLDGPPPPPFLACRGNKKWEDSNIVNNTDRNDIDFCVEHSGWILLIQNPNMLILCSGDVLYDNLFIYISLPRVEIALATFSSAALLATYREPHFSRHFLPHHDSYTGKIRFSFSSSSSSSFQFRSSARHAAAGQAARMWRPI